MRRVIDKRALMKRFDRERFDRSARSTSNVNDTLCGRHITDWKSCLAQASAQITLLPVRKYLSIEAADCLDGRSAQQQAGAEIPANFADSLPASAASGFALRLAADERGNSGSAGSSVEQTRH